MKTIGVHSPPVKGPEVRHAQTLLTTNVFNQDYMRGGAIDGEFGPETGRACIRAKYWLGYSTKDQLQIYGDQLDHFLDGTKKLPILNQTRRNARIRAKAKQDPNLTLGQRAITRAKHDLGMKEYPPYSNICPISKRWKLIGPWCAESVSEWFIDVGSKAFTEGKDWAYVPWMLYAAEQGHNGLAIVRWSALQPGMIVCFDWDNDGVADHTGIVITKTGPTTFRSIEGNTGVGRDSDGGEVMERNRNLSDVATFNHMPAFIHVGK